MKKHKKIVLNLILAVIIGSCLVPGSALCTNTVLNEFTAFWGDKYYGLFGIVLLDVTPGQASFGIIGMGEEKSFSFSTSLTLYPENFVFGGAPITHLAGNPPPGTPLSGEIMVWGDVILGSFDIINPNIVSEDQFGFYYILEENYVSVPGHFSAYGWATNEIPEPSTMLLLGSGLIGLAGYGRKKFFRK